MVRANGEELPGTYQLRSLTIAKDLQAAGTATLVLLDGDPATGEFPASDSDAFKFGAVIEILAGYDREKLASLFCGPVVRLALDSQEAQGVQLTVLCQEETAKVPASQNDQTLSGQPVADDADLRPTSPGDAMELVYGQNIYSFSLMLDAPSELAAPGAGANLSGQPTPAKGSVMLPGNGAVQPGSTVQLTGIGTRFGGQALVSKVTHSIVGGDWRTELTLSAGEQMIDERSPHWYEPTSPVAVANAGLVLLWPFLPTLFERLGYLANQQFRSEAAQQRAALLLHFLATGSEGTPDLQLPLNKLLCGIGQAQSLPRALVFTNAEKATSEDMLQAAISRWGAVKNSSVYGLRTTFLQRPGQLEWLPERVMLSVETQTVDVLLDRLPWAIGLLKLPWMAAPLHVSWR